MRSAGRSDRKRIASLALLAVLASVVLPLGAAAIARPDALAPTQRSHIRRLHVEARPVVTRRPSIERLAPLPSVPSIVLVLVAIGVVLVACAASPAWSPGPIPSQRGPPFPR